jgi:RND family efflux transporter MFP subunit
MSNEFKDPEQPPSAHEEPAVDTADLATRGPRRPLLLASMAALVLGAGTYGVAQRLQARREVQREAGVAAGPRRVMTAPLRRGTAAAELSLPGTVAPVERSVLNGMVNGVVQKVVVNIGDRVKKGDLLATIDAPETAAQYASARTRVTEAQQNVALIRQKMERSEAMSRQGLASQQELDTVKLELNSALALVDRSRADASRFGALVGYQRVTAPFDGTVTRRLVDPGAVVAPGMTPLFEVATTQRLKITLDVPQAAADAAHPGHRLQVQVRGRARPVEAPVLRTSGAIDPASRTLRVELDVPPEAGLLAGSYVTVRVAQPAAAVLLAPASAIVTGAAGVQVLLVEEGGRIARRTVRVVRDLGRELELEGELKEGDRVVLFPPVDLRADEIVVATEASARAPSPPPAASSSARPAP